MHLYRHARGLILPFLALPLLTGFARAQDTPGVRCILVVPPNEQPWPDAKEKLDVVLKDVQWWYSCQMEAYGYGPKTFSLETDDKGKVVVHVARLREPVPPTSDAEALRSAVIQEAEKIVGKPSQRKGTVMVLAYNGYYWTDSKAFQMKAMGWGLSGRWAHFSGWHLSSVNSKLFLDETPIPNLSETNPYFSPTATSVYKAYKPDGTRTVGERASCSHGAFLHEMGHSFGLHHPDSKAARIVGDVMSTDFWNARGNFVAGLPNHWTCLTPGDAAILNRNPLFQPRTVASPSTGAARTLGAKGALTAAVAISRDRFAPIDLAGSGFTVERLGKGEKSHSNRDYVWKDVPPVLEGFLFSRTAGGTPARVTVSARRRGRVYVSTAEAWPPALCGQGWQMIPQTLSYASRDFKRTYEMFIYYKELAGGSIIQVPQLGWAGTIVFAPNSR